MQLTNTPKNDEWAPAWSPDGRWLAFLSDRGDDDAQTQVWAMPAGGGEARVLTSLPGGVDDFQWSPDSQRLALVAADPERPAGTPKPKNPPPIVTDRFHFKQDVDGYLGARRSHLYLHDVATGQTTQLTSGAHDEASPSWSPDGRQIVYVTHRGEDPDRHSKVSLYLVEARAGATEKPLTQLDGADSDSMAGLRPQWSPDGRRIAFLQGGEEKWIYYAPMQLAIIDAVDRRGDRACADRSLVRAAALDARRQERAGADRAESGDPPVAHRRGVGQGHAAHDRAALSTQASPCRCRGASWCWAATT